MKIKYFYYIYIPLLISYIFIPHSYFWDPINYGVFKLLNSSLYLGKPVQIFWALLNNHWNDWVIDVVFITFFIVYIQTPNQKTKGQKIADLFKVAAVMFFTVFIINKIIFRNYFPIQINSPSLTFTGYLNINHLLPFIKSKVYAHGCFPGDHATTAILFYFLTKSLFTPKASKFLGIYIIFLVLPRLVIGAHNFTDIILGSLPIAFTTAVLWNKKLMIFSYTSAIFSKLKGLLFKKNTSPL